MSVGMPTVNSNLKLTRNVGHKEPSTIHVPKVKSCKYSIPSVYREIDYKFDLGHLASDK